jgi:hypothetical protein
MPDKSSQLTVGELIEILSQFDRNSKVTVSVPVFDHGGNYGGNSEYRVFKVDFSFLPDVVEIEAGSDRIKP